MERKSEDKKQGSSDTIVDKLYWSELDTELIEGTLFAALGVNEYTQYDIVMYLNYITV